MLLYYCEGIARTKKAQKLFGKGESTILKEPTASALVHILTAVTSRI